MADAQSRASASASTIPCSSNDSASETVALVDVERARAFELARQKFAVYGREHAHVNHLAPARRVQSASAAGATRSPVRIRLQSTATAAASATDTGTAIHAPATALKNTLLLQENGELALHIDSLNYHLDGVLTHCGSTDEQRGSRRPPSRAQLLTAAQNTVALARLLALEPVQRVLKLSATGQRLCERLRSVLRLLWPSRVPATAAPINCGLSAASAEQPFESEQSALRLAVAALALVLAQSPDPDELFSSSVFDAIAVCMRQDATEAQATDSGSSESSADVGTPALRASSTASVPLLAAAAAATTASEGRLQLRKACLKRKASFSSSSSRDRSSSTSSVEELLLEDADAIETTSPSRQLGARTSTEFVTEEIVALLSSLDAFSTGKRTLNHVTATDVLVLVLHSLLQLERPGADRHDHTRRYHSSQRDVATAAFSSVLERKRQLAENHGLSALIHALERQFVRLKTSSSVSTTHVSDDRASTLWRLHAILSVLDQASFLAVPVQQYLVSKPVLIETLLHCVDHLSAACWHRSHRKSAASPSSRQRSTDVLLVALRVLINLTHHNDVAAYSMHAHSGTRVLVRAFCKVWGVVEAATSDADATTNAHDERSPRAAASTASVPALEDKTLFDAQLLCLSALTNCVEFSGANQLALTTLELSRDDLVGLDAVATARPCELLAHYFVRKVQSFAELLERSETQAVDSVGATSASCASVAHWVPEDVVLGGCVSLLLGCLMKGSRANARAVLSVLPDHSPRLLLRALSAFVALHSQIGALTPEVGASVLQVEQTLRSLGAESDADTGSIELVPQSIRDVSCGTHEPRDCAANGLARTSQDVSCERVEAGRTSQSAPLAPAKRWKNVCSAVDSDSDSGGGDSAATQTTTSSEPHTKPTRSPRTRPTPTTRSPGTTSSSKRGRTRSPALNTSRKTESATSRAATPPRSSPCTTSSAARRRQGVTRDASLATHLPVPARSKRALELVRELTQKLSRVSDDSEQPQPVRSAASTPRVDWSQSRGDDDERMDELDFSRDYEPRRPSASPKTASPGMAVRSRDASPGTPSMRRRRQLVGRLHGQKSPSRVPLAAALAAIDSRAASHAPVHSSLEVASRPRSMSVCAQSPSSESALKRKRKIDPHRVLLESVGADDPPRTTSRSSSSTAVFDFDA